jgi:hypothetical protein
MKTMRKHFVLVVIVMVITVSLFAAWFVHFLDVMITQQSSSQVLNMTGQVESAQMLGDWSEVHLDQTILPNTYLRTYDGSTLTIWLDSVSRLVLQPNTQVHYLGFQDGTPTWQVIAGTINGRYAPPNSDRSLTIQIDQSMLTVTQATFRVRNELTEKSVTAYDQSLAIQLGASPESDLAQTISIQPGETYSLNVSDQSSPVVESTNTPTYDVSLPIETITENDPAAVATDATIDVTTTTNQPLELLLPESLQNFAMPTVVDSINLTIGSTQPLTFIWTEAGTRTAQQNYRIFRSESTPLDEKTANGYRTTTGAQHVSYAWPLPSTETTYHLRVCRLKNNQCEAWSNTITIPAGTFSQ